MSSICLTLIYVLYVFAAAMFQCWFLCSKVPSLPLYSFGRCTRSGDAYGHLLVSNLLKKKKKLLRCQCEAAFTPGAVGSNRFPFEFVHLDMNEHGNGTLVRGSSVRGCGLMLPDY